MPYFVRPSGDSRRQLSTSVGYYLRMGFYEPLGGATSRSRCWFRFYQRLVACICMGLNDFESGRPMSLGHCSFRFRSAHSHSKLSWLDRKAACRDTSHRPSCIFSLSRTFVLNLVPVPRLEAQSQPVPPPWLDFLNWIQESFVCCLHSKPWWHNSQICCTRPERRKMWRLVVDV